MADVGDKTVLITALPQPVGLTVKLNGRDKDVHLPNVVKEAKNVQTAFGGPEKAELLEEISFSQLDAALSGREVWCFAGHGDAQLDREPTLAFTKTGQLESVKVATIAATVRKHARFGKLRLVVFTGCSTLKLAEALQEQAEVEFIVCWSSVLSDEAGLIFGAAFARETAAGLAPRAALDKAREAVHAETEEGFGSNGLAMHVQKFELDIDPWDAVRVVQDTTTTRSELGWWFPPAPLDGAITTPAGSWAQRLGAHRSRLVGFPPKQRRGRLAAGVPELLDRSARKDADVPAAAQQLLNFESRVKCEDDNEFKHEVERVVELLVATYEVPLGLITLESAVAASDAQPTALCLTGPAHVGKSVLTAEVISSCRVRHHFREGRVLWMAATKSADELFPEIATELQRLLKAQWGDCTAPTQSDLLNADAAVSWIGRRLRVGTVGCLHCLLVLDGVAEGPAGLALASAARRGGMHVLLTTRLTHMQAHELAGDGAVTLAVKPTWKQSPQALFSRCACSTTPWPETMHCLPHLRTARARIMLSHPQIFAFQSDTPYI